MYDIAAKFESKEEAGKVYTTLENTLKELRFFAHVSRLQLGNDFYVSLIYDGDESSIPTRAQQKIQELLSKGQICRLPPATIATIQKRRENRRAQGIGTYVSHDETKVSARTPVLRDAQTKEEIQAFPELTEITNEAPHESEPQIGSSVYPIDLKQVPQDLRAPLAQLQADMIRKKKADSRPFFIRYRDHIEQIYNAEGDEGFDLTISIYIEQLYLMDTYLFTSSAIQLFQAVCDLNKNDFPVPDSDIWIEFTSPIETPYGEVKALIIAQTNRQTAVRQLERKSPGLKGISELDGFGETTLYRIQALDEKMDFFATEHFDADVNQWIDTSSHKESKSVHTAFWASWARSLLLIIAREYATSPDPKPFPIEKQSYQETIMKRVGHGKNSRIVKSDVSRSVEYKLVTFDVSRPEPRQIEPRAGEDTQDEKRANWLTTWGEEYRIYKKVHFSDIARTYTGTHYQKLIQKCIAQGGTFTEEGREYRLISNPEGDYGVVSALVDYDRYVPMLRPDVKKQQTIKKVVASDYPEK